jgi:crossover junction endodeoxyribonuclease RusA
MNQITITLPMPHKHLSPNSRCHWAQKSTAKKAQRSLSALSIIAALKFERPLWSSADVAITVTAPDKRRRDRDNLLSALKGAFDGAQDAGLISDDSGLTYLPIQIVTGNKATAGITLTFTKTN